MATFIFFYVFGLVILWFLAAGFHFLEEKPKVAARLFLSSFVWPVVALYVILRYGRGFVTATVKTAELHEFVIQEQGLWQGSDSPPVGKEKR